MTLSLYKIQYNGRLRVLKHALSVGLASLKCVLRQNRPDENSGFPSSSAQILGFWIWPII
jgi:hypothetical protein